MAKRSKCVIHAAKTKKKQGTQERGRDKRKMEKKKKGYCPLSVRIRINGNYKILWFMVSIL